MINDKTEYIAGSLASITVFFSPFVAAGISALAWYLHLVNRKKIKLSIGDMSSAFLLGLFVGYLVNIVIVFILKVYADCDDVSFYLLPAHDVLIAFSGMFSPRILTTLENVDSKGLLWFFKRF